MYRIKNSAPNIFAFWGEKQKDGVVKVYEFDNEDDVKKAGRQLTKIIGTDDIRVVQDEDYYLQLIYGTQPAPEPITYELIFESEEGIEVNPTTISGIMEGESVTVSITFMTDVRQFHLVVDDEELTAGWPAWIIYDDAAETLTVTDIKANHKIEIKLD